MLKRSLKQKPTSKQGLVLEARRPGQNKLIIWISEIQAAVHLISEIFVYGSTPAVF